MSNAKTKEGNTHGMIHARVPNELRRQLSILAAAKGITLTSMVETALDSYCEREWTKTMAKVKK